MTRQASAASVGAHRPSDAVLYTVRQVAERLHVSTGWVYRQIEALVIGHTRLGATLRVSAADLDTYLRRFPGIAPPPSPRQAEDRAPARPAARRVQ